MSDQIFEIVKILLSTLVGGAVGFMIQKYKRPVEIKDEHEKNTLAITQTSTETIAKLIDQVNGLIERDIEKEKRIRDLEETNKKYINAYNRAFTFIRKRIPVEEIPDFMITQDLRPLAEKKLK